MSNQLDPSIQLSAIPPELVQNKPHSAAGRILFALIGGTAVWAIYFTFVYSLTSLSCFWSWFDLSVNGSGPALKITQAIATVIALALTGYFSFVAFQEWRDTRDKLQTSEAHIVAHQINAVSGEEAETITARNPMLAFVTLLLNMLYMLIIVVSFVPIFVLPACFR